MTIGRAAVSLDTAAPAVRRQAAALSWQALAGMALALALALVAVVSLALMPPRHPDGAAWQAARDGVRDCVLSLDGATATDRADAAACADAAIGRAAALP